RAAKLIRLRGSLHEVIAQDQDPLWKRLQSRNCIFDALDDDGAGRTAENLFFAVPMHVRVIPVQPGRLIARNLEAIFERSLRGKDPGTQRFILMACGGTRSPWKCRFVD